MAPRLRVTLNTSIKERILRFKFSRSLRKNGRPFVTELHDSLCSVFPDITKQIVQKWVRNHRWIEETDGIPPGPSGQYMYQVAKTQFAEFQAQRALRDMEHDMVTSDSDEEEAYEDIRSREIAVDQAFSGLNLQCPQPRDAEEMDGDRLVVDIDPSDLLIPDIVANDEDIDVERIDSGDEQSPSILERNVDESGCLLSIATPSTSSSSSTGPPNLVPAGCYPFEPFTFSQNTNVREGGSKADTTDKTSYATAYVPTNLATNTRPTTNYISSPGRSPPMNSNFAAFIYNKVPPFRRPEIDAPNNSNRSIPNGTAATENERLVLDGALLQIRSNNNNDSSSTGSDVRVSTGEEIEMQGQPDSAFIDESQDGLGGEDNEGASNNVQISNDDRTIEEELDDADRDLDEDPEVATWSRACLRTNAMATDISRDGTPTPNRNASVPPYSSTPSHVPDHVLIDTTFDDMEEEESDSFETFRDPLSRSPVPDTVCLDVTGSSADNMEEADSDNSGTPIPNSIGEILMEEVNKMSREADGVDINGMNLSKRNGKRARKSTDDKMEREIRKITDLYSSIGRMNGLFGASMEFRPLLHPLERIYRSLSRSLRRIILPVSHAESLEQFMAQNNLQHVKVKKERFNKRGSESSEDSY